MEYTYPFKIDAPSKPEADRIALAMDTLYRTVNNDDLVWVAEKIKEDPGVIKKVMKLASNPMVKRLW